MKASGSKFLAVLLGLWVVANGASATAKTPKEKAVALAQEGVALMGEGRLDEALVLFERAYRLDPAPVLLGHMGKAWERKGDLAKARALYERWVAEETDPERLAKAKARLEDLMDRIPGRLVVTVTPAGARVRVDGRTVEAGSAVELRRGRYEIEVTMEGYEAARRTAEVVPGGEARVSVDLTPLPGRLEVVGGVAGAVAETPAGSVAETPAPAPGAAPTEGVTGRAEVRSFPWPWVAVGAGAAAVVVGGVMSGLASRERSAVSGASREGSVVTGVTMQDAASHVDRARTYDRVGYVMYGVGGAAVVAGVVWMLTQSGPASDAESGHASVGASPVPGGMAVSAGWRF